MKKFAWILILLFAAHRMVTAQEQTGGSTEKPGEGQIEELRKALQDVKKSVDKTNKLKFSGYIQAQYQFTDSRAHRNGKPAILQEGHFHPMSNRVLPCAAEGSKRCMITGFLNSFCRSM